MKRWQEVMPERDRGIYEKAGCGKRRLFGQNPALLVIDVTIGFIGRKPEAVLDSIEEFMTSCGEVGWEALPNIKRLLDACREKHIPIVYTRPDHIARTFVPGTTKVPITCPAKEFEEQNKIPESIAPREDEWVLEKAYASTFFATPLASYLRHRGVDSLLVVGCTTSGCVRASVVEGHSHGFSVFVVEECVFDRAELSHLVSLYEMNAKYADVITLAEAMEHVSSLKETCVRAKK